MNQGKDRARVSLQNILVATDFSEASEKAFVYAIKIARRYAATIHLLHVIRPGLATAVLTPQALPADIERERQAAADQLQSWAQRVGDLQHRTWLKYGEVAEIVKTLTDSQHFDLIVVGTHGRSGLSKFVLGSVAEAIFHEATCPVLATGPRVRETTVPGELRHILYAVDPLQESHKALDYAVSLAERNGATLTLLHVIPESEPPSPSRERINDCRELLHTLIPQEAQLPARADCRVEFSKTPISMIITVAQELPADLMVIDVRREESWATHLPDNASSIVTQAPCPVLTVHTVRTHTF